MESDKCKYNKKGMCHLGEMEDCEPCGIPALDKKVHPCGMDTGVCFDDAIKE